jgi:hypothetical protein
LNNNWMCFKANYASELAFFPSLEKSIMSFISLKELFSKM